MSENDFWISLLYKYIFLFVFTCIYLLGIALHPIAISSHLMAFDGERHRSHRLLPAHPQELPESLLSLSDV